MYCRGINRKDPLAGDGLWKIWRSYSALGEYGLWKNNNTPTIRVSVQLHPFHEVEIKQHRVIMTEYVFHTLEANLQH